MRCFYINITFANAQQNEQILASIDYKFSHLQDTSKKNVIYNENMKLLLAKNSSVFISIDKKRQAENMDRQKKEQANEANGGLTNFKFEGLRKTNNSEIYTYFKDQKIVIKEFLARNYIYEIPLDQIAWKLSSDTLTIETIKCRKATAFFKGRNWTAWYAPDLPFASGPWKLNGLPGLIIEAYDDKKEVQFSFDGFTALAKKEINKTNTITLPTNKVIKTSKEELDKLRKAMHDNPRGFILAQLKSTGGLADDGVALQGLNYKKINNPIELD